MSSLHYHVKENWSADPNGLIYFNDTYHLFYQYFPFGKRWGTMHWGHATSEDLVHWQEQPIALYPSTYDDQNGCFSGSSIEKDGRLHLFYTGVRYITFNPTDHHKPYKEDFVACQMTMASEDGIHFDNEQGKRVILPVSTDRSRYHPVHTRDPKVWKTEDGYAMVLGTALPASAEHTEDTTLPPEVLAKRNPHAPGHQGALLFYTSPDLENWEWKKTFTLPNMGWMWECADFVQIPDHPELRVWIFSPMDFFFQPGYNRSQAHTGIVRFNESTFDIELCGDLTPIDYGLELYAPQSLVDEEGQPVVIHWLRMPKTMDDMPWSGLYAYPRRIECDGSQVRFPVHPNIQAAFDQPVLVEDLLLDQPFRLSFTLPKNQEAIAAGLKIQFDGHQVQTDRSDILCGHTLGLKAQAPVEGESVDLELYGDDHVFELYINNGEKVITQCMDKFQPVFHMQSCRHPKAWILSDNPAV